MVKANVSEQYPVSVAVSASKQILTVGSMFAGIGGCCLAFRNSGFRIAWANEFDKHACITYRKNFPDHSLLDGDVREVNTRELATVDVLVSGFPCQSFSRAGYRRGFDDARGNLFFETARFIRDLKPKAFLIENVKGLGNHDGGRTLKIILNTLRHDLGYHVPDPVILNSRDYCVPQRRERIYIVGFSTCGKGFAFPKPIGCDLRVLDILEKEPVNARHYLSQIRWAGLKRHRERHKAKGHGFGYEILDENGFANTLMVGGMGRERNLILDLRTDVSAFNASPAVLGHPRLRKNIEHIRFLTPAEWELLQGFPRGYTEGVADGQRYKQLGNSVSVPVVERIAREIATVLAAGEGR